MTDDDVVFFLLVIGALVAIAAIGGGRATTRRAPLYPHGMGNIGPTAGQAYRYTLGWHEQPDGHQGATGSHTETMTNSEAEAWAADRSREAGVAEAWISYRINNRIIRRFWVDGEFSHRDRRDA
jgi:hypothetical protein